jgi:hypothetical protein
MTFTLSHPASKSALDCPTPQLSWRNPQGAAQDISLALSPCLCSRALALALSLVCHPVQPYSHRQPPSAFVQGLVPCAIQPHSMRMKPPTG